MRRGSRGLWVRTAGAALGAPAASLPGETRNRQYLTFQHIRERRELRHTPVGVRHGMMAPVRIALAPKAPRPDSMIRQQEPTQHHQKEKRMAYLLYYPLSLIALIGLFLSSVAAAY